MLHQTLSGKLTDLVDEMDPNAVPMTLQKMADRPMRQSVPVELNSAKKAEQERSCGDEETSLCNNVNTAFNVSDKLLKLELSKNVRSTSQRFACEKPILSEGCNFTNTPEHRKTHRYDGEPKGSSSPRIESPSAVTSIGLSRNIILHEPVQAQSHDAQVETQVHAILAIHHELCSLTCLRPRAEVNQLFGNLVGICVQTLPHKVTEKIMRDPRIVAILPSIRAMASKAESLLESHWASLILSSTNFASDPSAPPSPALSDSDSSSSYATTPASSRPSTSSSLLSITSAPTFPSTIEQGDETLATLKSFPYYQNYVDLARMEISTILPLLRQNEPIEKIAFIGSGPLPLTSFCLSQLLRETTPTLQLGNTTQPPIVPQILNVDSSPAAISLSSSLTTALSQHFPSQLFACELAGHPSRDLTPYTVVFLAALVGATQSAKEDILLAVVRQMRSGSLIVIRTSHGLRGVLYPEFEFAVERVLSAVEILAVVHPYSHVVNSVVVGRVR